MIKNISKILLAFILVVYATPVFSGHKSTSKIYFSFIKNFKAKESFIKSLDTNHDYEIIDILYEFNFRVVEQIVRFKGKRPITIANMGSFESALADGVLGRAYVLPTVCHIVINERLIKDYYTLKTTILHEYLHCLGYNHVDKESDLMYYQSGHVPESNIQDWAERVEKEIFRE